MGETGHVLKFLGRTSVPSIFIVFLNTHFFQIIFLLKETPVHIQIHSGNMKSVSIFSMVMWVLSVFLRVSRLSQSLVPVPFQLP